MRLHQLFFFILSLACTLLSAAPVAEPAPVPEPVPEPAPAPVPQASCPAIGAISGASIRNRNGMAGLYYDNSVTITVVLSTIQPTLWYPWGSVVVQVSNTNCHAVTVTFTLENGRTHSFRVGAHANNMDLVIPETVRVSGLIRIAIEAAF